MPRATIPAATYRLQFNASFTFEHAIAIVDYLDALGVSHCYASSYLTAVPGSTHGYDVVDPSRLNPDIGDEQGYARWIATLRSRGMGHILDLVPNHMGIAKSANPWWQDVLENGPSSRDAPIFDIDWHPLKPELDNKVLLPILGASYGTVLERQDIRLEYRDGGFFVRYLDDVLPVAPGTYGLTAIRHLPGPHVEDAALRAETGREKEVIKRRLAALSRLAPQVRAHITRTLETFNGSKGDPRSFDRIDALGTWPLAPMTPDDERRYRDRIAAYMQKAVREAKVFTSWLNPRERHEQATTRFIDTALAPDNHTFRDDFLQFERRVARYGIYNSLAQLAVKIGAPGVPDFYQGTDIWDFSLVDPDNRRPVDYRRRQALLRDLDATSALLRFRRAHLAIFQLGGYHPLQVEGARRDHVFAFARLHGREQVLVVIPRLVATLLPDAEVPPLGERVWGDTRIRLPAGAATRYRHVLTGDCVQAGPALPVADVFARFPIAYLQAA